MVVGKTGHVRSRSTALHALLLTYENLQRSRSQSILPLLCNPFPRLECQLLSDGHNSTRLERKERLVHAVGGHREGLASDVAIGFSESGQLLKLTSHGEESNKALLIASPADSAAGSSQDCSARSRLAWTVADAAAAAADQIGRTHSLCLLEEPLRVSDL